MVMKITVKPKDFVGDSSWQSKMNGVVFVEKEEDIEPLFKLLCEQDDYWEHYKHIIKVAPKEIDSEGEISRMCQYAGKTDIYDIESLKAQVDFIIYQEHQVY